MFSIMAAPVYNPTKSALELPFLHISQIVLEQLRIWKIKTYFAFNIPFQVFLLEFSLVQSLSHV